MPCYYTLRLCEKMPLTMNKLRLLDLRRMLLRETFCQFSCAWNLNLFFFYQNFSFTNTDDSQDSREREGTIFYFTLPIPPAYEHWDIYLQLSKWDDYHIFLIATLVFTRLLLDEIYHFIELPFDWLIDDAMFVCLLDKLILGFCYSDFDIGNRWIWTRIDCHPCITSEQTNQVCLNL